MANQNNIQYVRYYAPGSEAIQLEPQRRRKERPAPRPVPEEERIAIRFNPVEVFGCTVAVIMVVCVIIGFCQLYGLNDQLAQARTDLSNQKNIHYELQKNYENGYDLDEIRSAAEAMGLVPMEEVQHITITIPEPEVTEELPRWQQWWLDFQSMFE